VKLRSSNICFDYPSCGQKESYFLLEFGFDPRRWEELAIALKEHAIDNEITREERTTFGIRYVIEGLLKAPDGRRLNVRTAWFIEDDGEVPRFITTHPLRRRR
jgi:hypothetical protein